MIINFIEYFNIDDFKNNDISFIIEEFGTDFAFKFWRECAGFNLCFHKRFIKNNAYFIIQAKFGKEIADKMLEKFNGMTIYIPKTTFANVAKIYIKEFYKPGFVSRIWLAAQTGMSERFVDKVIAEKNYEQMSLF